jgi:hypothetical protein
MSKRKKRDWYEGQRLVRVDFKAGEAGLIYGTSRDIPGLLVAEPTLEIAVDRVPEIIRDMYLAVGKKIKRYKIAGKHAWIFLPSPVFFRGPVAGPRMRLTHGTAINATSMSMNADARTAENLNVTKNDCDVTPKKDTNE